MTDFFPLRELTFQLHEVHGLGEVLKLPRYAMHDRDTCDAILDAAHMLALEEFLPHAAISDAQEPHFDGTKVHLPKEVKPAIDAFLAGGFLKAAFDEEVGGLQLPQMVYSSMAALFTAANIGTMGYLFLTVAAANLLRAHGNEAQQKKYLLPMLEGRFFGTMCLSEPQAGSSLADIKTKAVPRADGRFDITGNKMWISGGEHDLSENIVQLVLAKIEGAPAGVKGISLFIVPKRTVNDDGSLGGKNGIRLIGLNHKMGYRGTTNTALAFGDGEACIGELIGEPHKGLSYMFHMMNEARIAVGAGAAALAMAGYRYALGYTQQRPQGRALSNKDPSSPPVNISEHPDVRRMLLAQKSYVEGALSLCLYCARLVDEEISNPDASVKTESHALLDLLTPIAKAWPSEWCLEANKLAIQCLGGYGYTRDYPVERLYRDNRLNPIHEGTNGIQGLDLLGRKVLGDGGKALKLLFVRMDATIAAAQGDAVLGEYATALKTAMGRIQTATLKLGGTAAQGQMDLAMANSSAYLELFGHTVIAWQWLTQALIAQAALPTASHSDQGFYKGKLSACRYFYRYELPKTATHADLLLQMDDTLLTVDVASL
ncbi:MAG: acyl-CoA dehydrogenase [Stagnimonas sp.]|nr:acyl-CoA dehydrogenase [Stagnimonas sp.]